MASGADTLMAALLIVQPLLDVASYFGGGSFFTMFLRLFLLGAVSLYGFYLSERKRFYAMMYVVLGAYWLLHMLNCIRVGYPEPVTDAAAFLKIAQFPLWTSAFLSFLRRSDGLELRVWDVLALDMILIFAVIGLSYLVGSPAYTYDYPERGVQIGVMGWFSVHSAQSAIVCMLAPAFLLWGCRSGSLWVFCFCTAAGLGLLFFTGTRMAYYAAILIAVGFSLLLLSTGKGFRYCIPLLAALILLLAFRGASPMAQRQASVSGTRELYQEQTDRIMGEDKDFVYRRGEEIPAPVLEKIKMVYVDVYGQKGVRGETLLQDMIGWFGLDRVMEEYDYTLDPDVLCDGRTRKLKITGLFWEREDFLTHLLGMDLVDGNQYDPENDIPLLWFYTGYLGTALYCGYILWILLTGASAFFRRFPDLLTLEFGAAVLIFLMGLAAAIFSGSVVRWPNVTVYLSVAAAQIVYQAETPRTLLRPRLSRRREPTVYLKKVPRAEKVGGREIV